MSATTPAVKEALAAANLPLWRSSSQTGYVFAEQDGTVTVTVGPPSGVCGPFGISDDRRSEGEWLLAEAADVLRLAGFGVARTPTALVVGRDLVDVFAAALSDKPKRIQRKRTKGWRMPEGAVYVGRPSRWGNWFKVSPRLPAANAVEFFRQDVIDAINFGPKRPETFDPIEPRARWVAEHIAELRGKDLACWCPEGSPCHADVLLELANAALSEDQEATERGRHEIEIKGDAA